MKKSTATTKRKTKRNYSNTKNIMMNRGRYLAIVHDAKAAGYFVGIGPRSQLGAWLADASKFYSDARLRTIELGEKRDERNRKRRNRRKHDATVRRPKSKGTVSHGKTNQGKTKTTKVDKRAM